MKQLLIVSAAALLGLAALPAAAQESPPPDEAPDAGETWDEPSDGGLTWTAGVQTDYVRRGVSRTEDGSVFLGADYEAGLFYAGAWASNVDVGQADVEGDFYVGGRPEIAGFGLDLSATYVAYLGQGDGEDLNHWETQAQLSRSIGPVWAAASVGWSPDWIGAGEEAWWWQADAAFEVMPRWTLSAAVGGQDVSDSPEEYTYWNVGTTYALTDRAGADVRWWDTDADDLGEPYEGRLVAGIKVAF
ncbi:MAG TPA: TorF family putative porin [Caulobacteraceae bacterium]|nr:TorF family putative porin [Caulobacteraceae bacterium]